MPKKTWSQTYRTKYQPLIDLLVACPEGNLTLSFAEIETILDVPLANSAYASNDDWCGTRIPHVRRWRAVGWRARLDRRNRCVHFARDTEG